jgi:pyruvate decarboxylase
VKIVVHPRRIKHITSDPFNVSEPANFSVDYQVRSQLLGLDSSTRREHINPSQSLNMAEQIDLARYLFTRLHQLGVGSIHGVPGDYNLTALDYIEPAGLHWVGNANELNAGYAADGYARVKGISAVITAFGVGELSAINAIGGAYAEMAPVVHIVGTPSTVAQNAGACLHHSLGGGNFRMFAEMYKHVTVAQANLTDPSTAASMIDRTLRECILQSRPVYIELPTNMVAAKISASLLQTPISTEHDSDEGFEDTEVDTILSKIYSSKQPFIIVDGFASRYGIASEADELVRLTGFPTSTTPFGKGIINETYPNFHGVYAGVAGNNIYMPWFNSCDLILRIAPLNSDVNTFGFTTIPDSGKTITFNRDSVSICDTTTFRNLHVKSLLRALLSKLDHSKLPKYSPYPSYLGNPRAELAELPAPDPTAVIDQHTFYRRVSTFFRPGDIILTETGTPSIGSRDFILPPHTRLINSSIWLSIGYMLPAAQGAALAQRELASSVSSQGRTILFEGDGSLQMTAQSISDIIRNRLPLTLFILNNDGYTIERFIHGMEAHYNDVQPWRYLQAANYFGAPVDDPSYPVMTTRVENWGEMMGVIGDGAWGDGKGLKIVEVCMRKDDAPESLKILVRGTAKRNSGGGEEVQKKAEVSG